MKMSVKMKCKEFNIKKLICRKRNLEFGKLKQFKVRRNRRNQSDREEARACEEERQLEDGGRDERTNERTRKHEEALLDQLINDLLENDACSKKGRKTSTGKGFER
jgi:hypothetical protein